MIAMLSPSDSRTPPHEPRPISHPSRLTGLRPTLARLWMLAHWPLQRHRYYNRTIETIDDVSLVVLPDVFNAVLFRGGEFLARTIAAHPLFDTPALEVLDMGTGTGVGAIFTARRGVRVTAVDINPSAIQCARINAAANGVAGQIDLREGDLFEPVAGERFDLVVFNPPFFRGAPADMLDRAWRSEAVFERFVAGLAAHLKSGGQAWVLLSTEGAGSDLIDLLRQEGFQIGVVAEKRWANEIMRIYSAMLDESRQVDKGKVN